MKLHLILNPASAGGKTRKREEEIRNLVQKSLGDCSISLTEKAGHAEELCRTALRDGVDAILVAGGDGTFNEVVNGCFEEGKPIVEQALLGIIPSGSGCDFRRTFGLSTDIEESIERIAKNKPTPIDLGLLSTADKQTKVFANIASAGLSAQIGVNTNQAKWLKKLNGALAFNWTILTTTLRHRRFSLKITTPKNDETTEWSANCVAVCNGQYFGSGVRIGREANPADGYFDVAIVHDLSPIGVLKGFSRIKQDDSVDLEGLTRFRAAELELSCADPDKTILIETDGEYGGVLPATFRVLPSALRIF